MIGNEAIEQVWRTTSIACAIRPRRSYLGPIAGDLARPRRPCSGCRMVPTYLAVPSGSEVATPPSTRCHRSRPRSAPSDRRTSVVGILRAAAGRRRCPRRASSPSNCCRSNGSAPPPTWPRCPGPPADTPLQRRIREGSSRHHSSNSPAAWSLQPCSRPSIIVTLPWRVRFARRPRRRRSQPSTAPSPSTPAAATAASTAPAAARACRSRRRWPARRRWPRQREPTAVGCLTAACPARRRARSRRSGRSHRRDRARFLFLSSGLLRRLRQLSPQPERHDGNDGGGGAGRFRTSPSRTPPSPMSEDATCGSPQRRPTRAPFRGVAAWHVDPMLTHEPPIENSQHHRARALDVRRSAHRPTQAHRRSIGWSDLRQPDAWLSAAAFVVRRGVVGEFSDIRHLGAKYCTVGTIL